MSEQSESRPVSASGCEEWCGVGWGRWQTRLAVLLALPVLLTGMYCTNYVFLAAPTAHRCQVPECEPVMMYSMSGEEWSPSWSAWALVPDDSCRRWKPTADSCTSSSFDNTTSISCEHLLYMSAGSIVSEFDLGCAEGKRAAVGAAHNVGMLVSLPIMGFVSDKWGRRTALVASGCGAGLLGLCKSFVTSYNMYLLAELLETVLGASVYPAAFVLMIEWLGVERRILASLVLGVPLSAGAALLAFLDYMAGSWRVWARVAYPPSFLLLLYPWLLPESVRWLITTGKLPEAVETIKKAAKTNRITISDDALEKMLISEKEQLMNKVEVIDEGLLAALVKYGTLRRRLSVCFVWWMSGVFVFYGLAVQTHALWGSVHVNYALVSAAELPALLVNTMLLDRVGRRPLLTAALLLTAAALISIPCLPQSSVSSAAAVSRTALYLAGKMGATMTLNCLYVYTAELFPTRARHRLLAACSTLGRLGAILAPLTTVLVLPVYYIMSMATHTGRAWIPTALFGCLPLLSAALTRLVPDTLHLAMPDTFADLDAARADGHAV